METFTHFIGIDGSSLRHFQGHGTGRPAWTGRTADAAVVVANKLLFHYQSSNDKKGIESFVKHLKQPCPEASFDNSLYCMEHTAQAALWDIQQPHS